MKLIKTIVIEDDDFLSSPTGEMLKVNGVTYNANLDVCDDVDLWQGIALARMADPRNVDLHLFSEPEAERFVYHDMGNFGFRNSAGETVIAPQFPTAREFSFGFAAVCVQCARHTSYPMPGLWNFINPAGEIQFEENFKWARDFNRYNVALVQGTEDTYFLVNKKHIKVNNSEFPYCEALSEGGWETDGDYRYLIYAYRDAEVEGDWMCGEESGVLYGIYDTADCTVLCPPKYRSVEAIVPGVFCVCDAKKRLMLIDKKGNDIGFVHDEEGYATPIDVAAYSWRGVGDYLVAWDRLGGVVTIYEQDPPADK